MQNVSKTTATTETLSQATNGPGSLAWEFDRPQRRARVASAFLEAGMITALGATIAYFGLNAPPVIGVDDANITQTYARNLVEGFGYVYTPGWERVEGSTSLLWTLLNVVAFAIASTPEYVLLALSGLLCCASVTAALLLADVLAQELRIDRQRTKLVCAIAYLSNPGFFAWNVWTLMDLAVWSPIFLWTQVLLCGRLTATYRRSLGANLGLLALSGLAVLARPEGGVIVLALLATAALLTHWQQRLRLHSRALASAAAVVVVSTVLVTTARLAYFGHPVPNTYYAKVSSQPLSQLVQGSRYVASFIGKTPQLALYLSAWLGLFTWVSAQRRGSPARSEGLAVAVMMFAGCCVLLVLYAGLGGDHFPMHRFFQPMALVLPIALAVAIASASRSRLMVPHLRMLPWASASAAILAVAGTVDFVARAPLLRREIDFAVDGRRIAAMLSRSDEPPSVGVIAAGGLARLYRGRVYDLMGLNWAEMAHADPTKAGEIRNHGGFDPATFYRALPELVALVGDRCLPGRTFELDAFEKKALKGINETKRFRDLYRGAALGPYLIFVRKDREASLARNPYIRLSTDVRPICESSPSEPSRRVVFLPARRPT